VNLCLHGFYSNFLNIVVYSIINICCRNTVSLLCSFERNEFCLYAIFQWEKL
jgi:hypothetical protein